MINTKHLTLLAFASSTLLFSGCVHTPDTFSNQNRQHNTPSVNVSLVSYTYPYYYNRPYYFFDNMYYYGGYFSNGIYHYGNRQFRHGHYYSRGNRYYKGRRYRAVNGQHGHYTNQNYYQRSQQYRRNNRSYDRKTQRRLDRGRAYNANQLVHNNRDNYNGTFRGQLKSSRSVLKNGIKRSSVVNRNSNSASVVQRTVRQRLHR